MKFRTLFVFVLFLTCLCLTNLFSDDLLILAVPNIEGVEVSSTLSSTCRNIVESALIKTGKYSVLSHKDMEEILSAQAFSLSGCTDESCAIEVGKLLAAEIIVVGELAGLGNQMILTLRLINVTTGKSMAAEVMRIASVDELSEKSFAAAYKLVGLTYVPSPADSLASGAAQISGAGSIYVKSPNTKILQVYLDGVLRGTTPVLIEDIPFGSHKLEAKEGDYVYASEIDISSKTVMEIIADVANLRGNLFLETLPPDATGFQLYINDKLSAPGLIQDLPVGETDIRVEGIWMYTGKVRVESGQTTKERVILTEAGWYKLQCYCPDAEIILTDNQGQSFQVQDTKKMNLPVGDWNLRITHPDYEIYEDTISISHEHTIKTGFVNLIHTEEYLLNSELSALRKERDALLTRRGKLKRQSIGWGIAALITGAAVGVCEGLLPSMITDFQGSYASYQAALTPTEALNLWESTAGIQKNIGIVRIVRTSSLAASLLTAIISAGCATSMPSTEDLDQRILGMEGKLNALQ